MKVLVQEESGSKDLLEPPHENFVELAVRCLKCPRNPWWRSDQPIADKEKVDQLFDNYLAIRRRKIRESENRVQW